MKDDTGECAVLVLLYLITVFHAVDNKMLGSVSQVLPFCGLYHICPIENALSVNGFKSRNALSPYGVPQGSILGPCPIFVLCR